MPHWRWIVALVLASQAGIAKAATGTGEFPTERLTVGGVTRVYRLVVPKSIDITKPVPLVVAFHGMLIDSKDVMPLYTKLNEAAAKHRFIVAYPNAVDGSWGLVPQKVSADIAFFDALVRTIATEYRIDPARLYVVGMSNGGYFAHLIARERSTKVAAAASHSGVLGLQTLLGVHAERAFPVLIIHGNQDRLLAVEFARENRDKYKREGHEVKYVEIAGLGHMWSAGASELIWSFFEKHPLPPNK